MTKNLLAAIFLLTSFSVFSQFRTYTPYSLFGIGDIMQNHSGSSAGMGGVSLGIQNSKMVNFSNPASYNDVDSNDFVADISISQFNSEIEISEASSATDQFTFNHFLLKFPLTSWWAVSIGAMPYSKVDYDMKNAISLQNTTGKLNSFLHGEGGINQMYFGNAWRINDELSLGVNLAYFWGTQTYSKIVDNVSGYDVNLEQEIGVNAVRLNFGAMYKYPLSKTEFWRFGLSYESNSSLADELDENQIVGVYSESGKVFKPTKVTQTTSSAIDLKLPHKFSIGASYNLDYRWVLGTDYIFETEPDFNAFKLQTAYKSKATNTIRLGAEYTPSTYSKSYFSLINYRFGGNWSQMPYEINGEHISQYTLSVGLGLPFPDSFGRMNRFNESKSMANISFEMGSRGTTSNGLVKENYYGVRLNVTLNNRWFYKRKYY